MRNSYRMPLRVSTMAICSQRRWPSSWGHRNLALSLQGDGVLTSVFDLESGWSASCSQQVGSMGTRGKSCEQGWTLVARR